MRKEATQYLEQERFHIKNTKYTRGACLFTGKESANQCRKSRIREQNKSGSPLFFFGLKSRPYRRGNHCRQNSRKNCGGALMTKLPNISLSEPREATCGKFYMLLTLNALSLCLILMKLMSSKPSM